VIETLLLDAGGVLVFPNWTRVSEVFRRHGVEVSADALRAAEPRAKFAIDTASSVATTNDADRGSRYFHLTFDGAGVRGGDIRKPVLDELWAYHQEHNLWEHVPPDVFPALQRLRASGLTLAIASNANGVLQRMFDRVGLTPYFHAICDSCIEGVEKPDPRFFGIVLERAGGRPETTMHVGDLYYVDVLGARSAGLQSLLLDPHGLYRDFDVQRIASLADLTALVTKGRHDGGDGTSTTATKRISEYKPAS
jgi:HAD superfamily hydrolase (TIGR01549 family)